MKRILTIGLACAFVLPAGAKLIHRYDFSTDGEVNDVVGSADGVLRGNAVVSGGALTTGDAIGTASSGTVANGVQLDKRAVAGLTGAFTVESWVSATLANDHRYATAWAFSDASLDNYFVAIPARGDRGYPSSIGVKGAGGAADEQLLTHRFLDDGAVHQIVATYDGLTVSYYVDGELVSSVIDAGLDLSALDVIGINGGSPYPNYSITGSTYDFRIYDQSLTANQVGAVYALGQDAATASIIAVIPEPKPYTENASVRLRVKCESESGEDHYQDVDTEMDVCTLMIGVKNGGEDDVSCALEWYFLSEDVVTGETGIFDHGKNEIVIAAGTVMKEDAVSKAFVVSTDGPNTWGVVYEGYIILVTRGGQILAKDSNSGRYLSEEWIIKCRNAR